MDVWPAPILDDPSDSVYADIDDFDVPDGGIARPLSYIIS